MRLEKGGGGAVGSGAHYASGERGKREDGVRVGGGEHAFSIRVWRGERLSKCRREKPESRSVRPPIRHSLLSLSPPTFLSPHSREFLAS